MVLTVPTSQQALDDMLGHPLRFGEDHSPGSELQIRTKEVLHNEHLPPQQATFRSAKLRDQPPHLISMSSKWPEVADDALPCQPRNSLSAVQSPSLDAMRPPNGADLARFPDGYECHDRQNQPPPAFGTACLIQIKGM